MQHIDFPGLQVAPSRRSAFLRYRDGMKRALDLAGVVLLAPVAVPLVALLWCAVRLSGGPGFFAHERVGLGGAPFRCWKLRTMVPDAEARLRLHLAADPAAALEWAQSYKLRSDPRVTRLGRVLRKTSLDELPQLWNVLRGEMSLVGPRPVPRCELAEYGDAAWAYLLCRPGLTGFWQTGGRNAVSYDERIRMDMRYLLEAGPLTDLGLILVTPVAMLRRTGL